MKEIMDIISAYDEAERAGKQTALATVVHVQGSSYRSPGARMLITEEGRLTGAISGGCLEGDALRKALLVMHDQKSKLVSYDTNDEDDASLGVGLGCNGIIQILIEPIDPSRADNPIQILKSITGRRENAVVGTLFSLEDRWGTQPGTCFLYDKNGVAVENISNSALQKVLQTDVMSAFESKTSITKNYTSEKNNTTAFIEFLSPPVFLVIVGAGNDAMPLVKMAELMGWVVTVIDGRPEYANTGRFASGCQVVVAKPEKALSKIEMDDQTVYVLMTHNYNYDLAMLKQLIHQNTSYIGVLGPKKKMDRMIAELEDEGIKLTREQSSKVYGPVGLDIGAETPEEIALAIVSEIKAVMSGRAGEFLRNNEDTIHSRASQEILKEKI
jgi:xanthine dehydrogenase accessory factor